MTEETDVEQCNKSVRQAVQDVFAMLYEKHIDLVPQVCILNFHNKLITQALIYKDSQMEVSSTHEHIGIITKKLEQLAEEIRLRNPEIYSDFEEQLFKAIGQVSPINPEQWFATAFTELVKQVGADPSWRATTNIVNCIHLVTVVANKYDQRHTSVNRKNLEDQMQIFLEDFFNENFDKFIYEMGGWGDFLDYYTAIKEKRVVKSSSAFWQTVLQAALFTGFTVIVLCYLK